MARPKVLLDTNIILRFFLNDHPKLSQKARGLFKKAEKNEVILLINDITLAEVVWVLLSFYQQTSQEVVQLVLGLFGLPNVRVENESLLTGALLLMVEKNISFIGAYNLKWAEKKGASLATFDSKLSSLSEKKKN